ncbi:MAG: hypothetical protein M3N53_03850 [Actinomycetota bacterium]|nr:hypothetical protein [Actinomycetota bacterium]
MSKKLLVLGLVLALCAALVAPAAAAKKKKPKPYKSEEVTALIGHPIFYSASGTVVGVTSQEFINRCEIPTTNGFDGYVFEVPAAYQKIQSSINATGTGVTDPAQPADIDIYLFDEACANIGAFNTEGTDESGTLGAGTKYIFLHNFVGGPTTLQFTLKAL